MSHIERRLDALEHRLQIDDAPIDLEALAESIASMYRLVEAGRLSPEAPTVQQVNELLAIARARRAAHEH